MKRILTMVAAAMLLVSCNNSKTNQNNTEMKQTVGQFQAYELDGFRLHVYNSNDVMADASFIIEGQDGLVVVEYPLFKVNAKEFSDYVAKLGKKVVTDITDYHLGGCRPNFVRCSGIVSFNVDDETKHWIYNNNSVLSRLYTSYDKLAYFSLPIAEMDYYNLEPTPPLFKHIDLVEGTESFGFVGERFKTTNQ